jgi:hypothetical protein
MRFDATFYAFQEISKVVDALVPKGFQLTKEQANLIHHVAERMASDLTSGTYEYVGRERRGI